MARRFGLGGRASLPSVDRLLAARADFQEVVAPFDARGDEEQPTTA